MIKDEVVFWGREVKTEICIQLKCSFCLRILWLPTLTLSNAGYVPAKEWKGVAGRFYDAAVNCGYRIAEIPALPHHPLGLVKIDSYIELVRPSNVQGGTKFLSFDEVFANEDAMNQLMSWAVSLYFPKE